MTLGRILVIDDEAQMHRFLKPALEAAGYEVERAETAADGLRLAAGRGILRRIAHRIRPLLGWDLLRNWIGR